VAAQGGSGSGRAVNGSGNGLFKLLENDSFESIVSGNYEIPEIQFLARSPVEGKKDIYISFYNEWQTDNGTVGSFIHVKEDGSVVNILEGWDSIDSRHSSGKDEGTSPLAFDRYGNMYFRVRGDDYYYSNSIYKYNPVTGKKEQLVPAVSNNLYSKIVVSPDGSYLIVDGIRFKSNEDLDLIFVRIISTANPQNMVEQITTRWYEGGQENTRLAYAFGQGNELYVSGEKIFDDENKNGFYKVSFEGISPDEWQWEKLFNAKQNDYDFGSIYILFVAPDNSVWGNNGSIARIINSNGLGDFYLATDPMLNPNGMLNLNGLRAEINRPFKSWGSHLYFQMYPANDDFPMNNIYRVSYNNPGNVQNLFSGITTLNAKDIYVFDFDIGGAYLYFNAVENPYVVDNTIMGDFFTGKKNLTTLEYTELEFSWNITAIVAY
jgi:hypothetical protein